MGSSEDVISELPAFILHQILGNLSFEETLRTSVLSRHWNSTWKSFPELYFDEDMYMKHVHKDVPNYRELMEEFLNFADRSVRKFAQSRLRIEVLDLKMRRIHVDSIHLINAWLPLALRNGVRKLSFSILFDPAHQKTAYPLSDKTFSINSNGGSSKFFNLKFLHLNHVIISKKIFGDITQNCPNISRIKIWNISGVKSLELSKLRKLEHLAIGISKQFPEIKRIFVDAPSLQSFFIISEVPCAWDLSLCLALKHLTLAKTAISDDILVSHILRFPLLETLEINICFQLRSIRISHPRLKFLDIFYCDSIESIFMDAPSLSKFKYKSSKWIFPQISSNSSLSNIDFICCLRIRNNFILSTALFSNLRRFLADMTMRMYLTLSLHGNKVYFNSVLLGEEDPSLIIVDHLDLNCFKDMDESSSFVFLEGMLWSCHPKVISFSTNEDVESCLPKVLCYMVLQSEDRSCCNLNYNKCWHHGLKAARIDFSGDVSSSDKINGIEYEQFRLALDQLSSSRTNKKVKFLLEWEYGMTLMFNEETESNDTSRTVNEATKIVRDSRPIRERKAKKLRCSC